MRSNAYTRIYVYLSFHPFTVRPYSYVLRFPVKRLMVTRATVFFQLPTKIRRQEKRKEYPPILYSGTRPGEENVEYTVRESRGSC